MVDRGVAYRLERASPPSVEVGGEIRYGRSDAVPSLLDEPPTGLATVVLLASADEAANLRSLAALDETVPPEVRIVVVADGVESGATSHETIRTSERLGRGAALNIGIRRASAAVVVAIDPSIIPSRDVVTPLVEALRDPSVAVVGPVGYATTDLRRFVEVVPPTKPVDVVAIQGELIAFRRTDVAARGPIDEAFRFPSHLDIWLSLVLRDEGEGRVPRRALAVPGLPSERGEPSGSALPPAAERDRLSKRNFYRVLDRFRSRIDLAVPAPPVRSGTDS